MAVDRKLVEQIDTLTRSDFRASINATRRATLAIGALVLHWGQFDSMILAHVQWLREKHKMLGFGGFPDAHPSDQAGQLNLLRKLIQASSADPGHLSEFDRIRQVIVRTTSIRNDL